MHFKTIAVEGPIGVGKTSLVDFLAERLEARKVLEPTDNPFLHEFYQDRPGAAFQCQLFFLLNRFRQQQELAQGNLFKQACSRYATRHQTFLERFLARHRTSLKLRWEDPFLGHGTLFQDTRPDVVAGDLALFGLWGEEGLSGFVAQEEFRFVSPLS